MLENDYKEFILPYNKHYVEKNSIQRAMKTTIEILYDKDLFDNYANADEVSKKFVRYKA